MSADTNKVFTLLKSNVVSTSKRFTTTLPSCTRNAFFAGASHAKY